VEPKEIFSPCAAAALYRASALREAGGFDEDYFCYSEDVDLGYRLRLLGYRCWYAPDSVAHHVGSAIAGAASDFTMYHGMRNGIWTYVKNMPALLLCICLPALIAGFSMVTRTMSRRGQGPIARRAIRDAIRGLPLVLRKRRMVQASRRVSTWTVWRMLDKSLPGRRR
jgi:GT2 family glycosyltransferase